jgi:hypothetical protein
VAGLAVINEQRPDAVFEKCNLVRRKLFFCNNGPATTEHHQRKGEKVSCEESTGHSFSAFDLIQPSNKA